MKQSKSILLIAISVFFTTLATPFLYLGLREIIPVPLGFNTDGRLWILAVAGIFSFLALRKIVSKIDAPTKRYGIISAVFIIFFVLGLFAFGFLQPKIPSKYDRLKSYPEEIKVSSRGNALAMLAHEVVQIRGEGFSDLKINLRFKDGKPEWIIWTRYKLKFKRYVMDAQTGDISGP